MTKFKKKPAEPGETDAPEYVAPALAKRPAYMNQKWYRDMEAAKRRAAKRLLKHKQEGYTYDGVRRWFVKTMTKEGVIFYRVDKNYNSIAPRYIVVHQGRVCFVELKGRHSYWPNECSPEEIEEHARLKKKGVETYVLGTRIDTYNELFTFAYTTYPSRHSWKNPKFKTPEEIEAAKVLASDHVKTGFMY